MFFFYFIKNGHGVQLRRTWLHSIYFWVHLRMLGKEEQDKWPPFAAAHQMNVSRVPAAFSALSPVLATGAGGSRGVTSVSLAHTVHVMSLTWDFRAITPIHQFTNFAVNYLTAASYESATTNKDEGSTHQCGRNLI